MSHAQTITVLQCYHYSGTGPLGWEWYWPNTGGQLASRHLSCFKTPIFTPKLAKNFLEENVKRYLVLVDLQNKNISVSDGHLPTHP